jgi:hypothetical protein
VQIVIRHASAFRCLFFLYRPSTRLALQPHIQCLWQS